MNPIVIVDPQDTFRITKMARSALQKSHSRRLFYFPIIHNQADMGALRDSVKQASLKKLGRSAWNRKIGLIDKLWTEIEDSVAQLATPLNRVRIYQDGLPVSGKEKNLVVELAKTGSRNHALILRLMNAGATVMGTESLKLLLQEYELAKRDLGSARPLGLRAADKEQRASLLSRRDRFIAKRINDTLLPDEVGMIFLGMFHCLEPWLEKDIEVIYPISRPVGEV
jgi:hypothetical protein